MDWLRQELPQRLRQLRRWPEVGALYGHAVNLARESIAGLAESGSWQPQACEPLGQFSCLLHHG